LPIGLLADELFDDRIRLYWYASAAMSAMNFCVARARRRESRGSVVGAGGRPARVR
jgi:hypothetical protein